MTGSRAPGSVSQDSQIRRSRVAGRIQATEGYPRAVRSRTNGSAPVHASGMGILRVVLEPAERVIGTIRRACLDHLIVFHEADLYRYMKPFVPHDHESRTHVWLAQDTPEPRSAHPLDPEPLVTIPHVGGLHHRYEGRSAWISQGAIPAPGGNKCISTYTCLRIEPPGAHQRQIRGARGEAKLGRHSLAVGLPRALELRSVSAGADPAA